MVKIYYYTLNDAPAQIKTFFFDRAVCGKRNMGDVSCGKQIGLSPMAGNSGYQRCVLIRPVPELRNNPTPYCKYRKG